MKHIKTGLKQNVREFLNYLVKKNWKIRAYIENFGKHGEDFVLTIEHDLEPTKSIIRFEQSHDNVHFHMHLFGHEGYFKEFPNTNSITDKINIALDFIKNNKTLIKFKNEMLNLDNTMIERIRKELIDSLGHIEVGKRTTSQEICSNVFIKKT